MTTPTSRDLGHGVRVMPGDGGGIVVMSADIDFGWRLRTDGRPGAAVLWDGAGFEVVDREPWRRGARWTLAPWQGEDVMRVVLPLDGATVNAAARAARRAARTAELRPWLWIGAPILGFAPASKQRRWRDDLAFPATLATALSAISEIVVGAICLIEFFLSVFGDESLLPWIPRPVIPFGLVFFVEGAIRLAQTVSDLEPVGSLFGWLAAMPMRRRSRMKSRSSIDQPGAVKTVLLTVAATLAPRRFQERWAQELGVWPLSFTMMGASAELIGGLSNLGGSGDGSELAVLLNLFFCGEAAVRFSSLIFTGRPLGSILGLPLAGILERHLPVR